MKSKALNQIKGKAQKMDALKNSNTTQKKKDRKGRMERRDKDYFKKEKKKKNGNKNIVKIKEKKIRKKITQRKNSQRVKKYSEKKNFTQILCRKIFDLCQLYKSEKMNLKVLSKAFKQGDYRRRIGQYLKNTFRQCNIKGKKKKYSQTSAFRLIRQHQSFIIFSFIEGNVSRFTSLQKKIHHPNFIYQDIQKQENKNSNLQKEISKKIQKGQLMKDDCLINQDVEQLRKVAPEFLIGWEEQHIIEDISSLGRYPFPYEEIFEDSVYLSFHDNQCMLQQRKNQQFQKNASQQSNSDNKTKFQDQKLSWE